MSAGFHRLSDDNEVLVNEAAISRPRSNGNTQTSRENFHSRWRPVLRSTFSHLHFDIGIILFVLLYTSFLMLEMIINLDMLTIHHTSPVPRWLHLMSVSILAYFVIEVLLRIYAFGYDILTHKLELFDITIVLTTFLFEMVFIKHEDALLSTGLLILLRFWRVANIINGLLNNVQNEKSRQILTLQKEVESYRNTNLRLSEKSERLERKVRFYEMELESRGISVEYETFEDLRDENNINVDLRIQAQSSNPTSPTEKSSHSSVSHFQSGSRLGDGHLAFHVED